MTQKAFIFSLILILFTSLLGSCKKENNGNNEEPSTPDTPAISYQTPPIDKYMPERLLHVFDSLNLLHRGDEPPTVVGDYVAESMIIHLVDIGSDSQYNVPGGSINIEPRYFEFKNQGIDSLNVTFKCPYTVTTGLYFMEQSNMDSTYFRIKSDIEQFINSPFVPSYFISNQFTAENLRHAYIIGNDEWFTIYFYEVRYISGNFYIYNSLPLNAILISGKTAIDVNGNKVIEDFWYGMETLTYYSGNVNYGSSPNPGDIIIMQSPNTVIQGSYDE